MSRLVHATCRYFLRVFGPGPARTGVSSPQMTRARRISARIVLFAAATALRGAVQQRVHPPVAGAGAGHRFEDARAALHRNVVHD